MVRLIAAIAALATPAGAACALSWSATDLGMPASPQPEMIGEHAPVYLGRMTVTAPVPLDQSHPS